MKRPLPRSRPRAGFLAACAGLLVASSFPTSLPGSTPIAGQPQIVLESLDGEVRTRPVGPETAHPIRDLDAALVRFENVQPPAAAPEVGERADIRLVVGDLVRARLQGAEGEVLHAGLLGGAVLTLTVDDIRSIVFPDRIPTEQLAAVQAPPEGDRIYRRTGSSLDRIDGTLERMNEEGVEFDGMLGVRLFPWNEIAALYLEPFGLDEDEPEGEDLAPVLVDMVDGSRLRGRLIEVSSDGARILPPAGSEVLLPLGVIAEIAVDDGRLAFLSELPAREEIAGNPFGDGPGMTWPFRVDRSVTDSPLRAGGRTWTRGLGVHAPSKLVWTLEEQWSSLRGLVAVDDQVLRLPARGSVRFRVFVDGEKRWESDVLRGGDPPVPIPPVSLEGAKELVLEVDMATNMHVADRSDWLRMLLVK